MSEAVYERYKDALRRGHVAALRGQLEAALAAYHEAASIATERALPHTSIGHVELRRGRPEEALAAFDAALARAPRDEAALLGRAEALARAGRAVEAARTLDLVAEVQDAAGRPVEALDSVRHALELAESRSRRRSLQRLVRLIRESGPDRVAEEALARAVRVLEAGVSPVEPAEVGPGTAGTAEAVAAPEPTPGPIHLAETPAPAEAAVPPPEPVPEVTATMPETWLERAEAAIDAGEPGPARDALLAAARMLGSTDRADAALDACYRALSIAPDDPELHLALVDLYLARGWRELATEKIALLTRLAELDGDRATLARVTALSGTRPGEPVGARPDESGPPG